MRLDLASGAVARLSSHIPWDVNGSAVADDGRLVALQANVDGRTELRLFDARTLRELPLPSLPSGSMGGADLRPKQAELAFAVNSAQGPSQLYTLDMAAGRVEQWTRAHAPPGVDMRTFRDQQIVRWTSFDGRSISGLLSRPPDRFQGRRPVVIDIHGGPEAQASVGFLGR